MLNINITLDEVYEEGASEERKTQLLIEKKIDEVIENMWKYNQTYKISTENLVINQLPKPI